MISDPPRLARGEKEEKEMRGGRVPVHPRPTPERGDAEKLITEQG